MRPRCRSSSVGSVAEPPRPPCARRADSRARSRAGRFPRPTGARLARRSRLGRGGPSSGRSTSASNMPARASPCSASTPSDELPPPAAASCGASPPSARRRSSMTSRSRTGPSARPASRARCAGRPPTRGRGAPRRAEVRAKAACRHAELVQVLGVGAEARPGSCWRRARTGARAARARPGQWSRRRALHGLGRLEAERLEELRPQLAPTRPRAAASPIRCRSASSPPSSSTSSSSKVARPAVARTVTRSLVTSAPCAMTPSRLVRNVAERHELPAAHVRDDQPPQLLARSCWPPAPRAPTAPPRAAA